jgi:hypothetical protein
LSLITPLMEFCFRSFNSLSERWLTVYRSHFDGTAAHLDPGSRDAQVRIAWYDLYLALVMVIEAVYREYPEGHDSWAREMGAAALKRLRHLLE